MNRISNLCRDWFSLSIERILEVFVRSSTSLTIASYNCPQMNSLRLFLFPDICPEEEACIRSCVEELRKSISIQETKVTEREKGFFRHHKVNESSWIVSRDWRGLFNTFLPFRRNRKFSFRFCRLMSKKYLFGRLGLIRSIPFFRPTSSSWRIAP